MDIHSLHSIFPAAPEPLIQSLHVQGELGQTELRDEVFIAGMAGAGWQDMVSWKDKNHSCHCFCVWLVEATVTHMKYLNNLKKKHMTGLSPKG